MQQSPFKQPFQQKNSARRYTKKRYGSFFQRQIARREQRLAMRLLREHNLPACTHFIDIPCGYGRFHPLLKSFGYRVTAMDQSEAMVQICQEQPEFDDKDSACRADILQPLPEPAAQAQGALCIRLFQHLHTRESRVQALKTLGGNQRPVVMTYYDSGCLHQWSKRALMWLKGKPVRIKMITRAQFESEVAEAGLRIVRRIKLIPGIHAQTWVALRPA